MSTDRFERDLPDLLTQLEPRAVPDYRDDIVRQTARMRQRPAWMFPERWLPVSVVTTRAFAAPPIRWRVVGIVALLILAMVVGGVLVAGSRPKVLAPFGPAANGLVAYEAGGHIYTADPVTGIAKAVVSGTQQDLRPVFSRDGTHFMFERKEAGSGRLIVARSDGRGLVVVTPNPVTGFDGNPGAPAQYTFSPDGTEIALWSSLLVGGGGQLWIAQADGSGLRQVDTPLNVVEASWLPPDGVKLVVTASTNGGANRIFVLDPRTSQSEMIVVPASGVSVDYVRVSPDGSRLAYSSGAFPDRPDVNPSSYRVHVVGLDGRSDMTLPMPAGAVFQDAPAWSNDGTRLAITRGYAKHNEDMAVVVLPADGSGVGIESARGLTGCCNTILHWSPDDTSILVMPETLDSQPTQHFLLNPSTLAHRPAPWTASSPPAWQRTVR